MTSLYIYVPGNFPIIFLVILKINACFDSTKSPLPNRTSINIHHIKAMRPYHVYRGIPQLLLYFLIMLMCNLCFDSTKSHLAGTILVA